jgi:uncharacterized membrane protein YadS
MEWIKRNGPGLLLCLGIAVPAQVLGRCFPVVGGAVIAILPGMAVTLFLPEKRRLESGIRFVSKKVLQWAVVLLGFGLNLGVILRTGRQSLPIILCTITVSLADRLRASPGAGHSRKDFHPGGGGLLHLRRQRHRGHGAGH